MPSDVNNMVPWALQATRHKKWLAGACKAFAYISHDLIALNCFVYFEQKFLIVCYNILIQISNCIYYVVVICNPRAACLSVVLLFAVTLF